MLIWPVFAEKQDEKEVLMPETGHKLTGGKRYWETQLAWSEYQYGRWTGKNLSESVRFEAIQGQPDILFAELVPRPGFTMARIKDTGGIPQPPHPDNDDGDQSPPAQPTSGATGETGPQRLIPGNLVAFKALADGNSLTVRDYRRLDYGGANPSVNAGISFPFGEFRFFGCRKIVTTATIAQMLNKNFALAPHGTRFDGMGFNQTGRGLTLLDGTFPAGPRMILPTPLADFNERKPLPSDASSTVVNRIDIPVLDGGGSPFRLLAPHQDLQFTANRPFFFIDGARTFMVSSTGASGFRPHPGDWVLGDLAAIGLAIDASPQTDGANDPADGPKTAVLLPGTNGNRIARELTPMNLSPSFLQKSVLPAFWTTRIFAFQNFYHVYVCDFVKNLDRKGFDGLLSLETQCLLDDQSFGVYKPTPQVMKEYPCDEVEFEAGGGYLERNLREFELTKSTSLLLLDPLALVKLRETGKCDIMLPEEIFDLDYPGHYFRRIKSVSLTLPCVVGPYTTISCTLRLLKNNIRINTANGDNGYPRNSDDQGLPAADDRFVENNIPINAIAASSAQNDSGMFEMSFRDERYLPFEGAGAISEWTLELFNDNTSDFGKPLRQFDYGIISDAILHVKYTARKDAGAFKNAAVAHLRDYFSQAGKTPSLRLFNLRQEFPTEWHRFLNPTDPADGNLFKFRHDTHAISSEGPGENGEGKYDLVAGALHGRRRLYCHHVSSAVSAAIATKPRSQCDHARDAPRFWRSTCQWRKRDGGFRISNRDSANGSPDKMEYKNDSSRRRQFDRS
jgi:Tc toxin complex TcA C-terminal TcB-binding domain